MGQILHGSAKTTHAIRGELQRSQASVASLAKRFSINEKTVLKWRKRQSVEDMPMGPKERRSTVLSPMEEAAIVALRVIAYNFAKQLKALKFKTPYQAIEELWKSKPDAFIIKPSHHMLGPNT